MVPTILRYAETHEWASLEGDVVTLGITQFAVEQLTDIVSIDLAKAKAGRKLAAKEEFGEIEAVKAVSGLYAPVAGEIVARNDALDPATISSDPYGKGWMIKIKVASKADYDKLLTPDQYEKQIASQGH